MRKINLRVFLRLLYGFVFVSSVYAHHGYAAYDMTKTITLTGTCTELLLENPHSALGFDVKDEKGNVTHWGVEFGGIRALSVQGFSKDALKPGDAITVSLHPAKNGAHVGVSDKVTFADGRRLVLNRPAGRAR